jgi:glycosyltransferase involved in cell wall biosynthesis
VRVTDIPRAFSRLASLIREKNIHILHTHLFHAGVLGLIAKKFMPGVRVVLTRHYSDLLYIYGSLAEKIADRAVSRHLEAIIAVSEAVKRVMVEYDKIDPSKITVIHNGVDPVVLSMHDTSRVKEVRDECGLGDSVVVGTVGSLHPRKGHRYFLEAASMIARSDDKVKFLIVGGGELERELVELASGLGIGDRVFFTGYRSRVNEYVANMDVFVQPSVEEGFGITILEAMAMGKPVIGTRIGGIPEIIRDGTSGILVTPKDPVAMSEAVLLMLGDPLMAVRMGESGKERVKKEFTLAGMIKKYERFYDGVSGRVKG